MSFLSTLALETVLTVGLMTFSAPFCWRSKGHFKTCRYLLNLLNYSALCQISQSKTEVQLPVFSWQSGHLLHQKAALSLVISHLSWLSANLKLSRHVVILTIACTRLIITISAGRNNLPARQAYPDYPRNTSLTHPATGQRRNFC